MQLFLDPVTVGDIKSVSVLATPSDRAHVVSGTYSIVQADTGEAVTTQTSPASGNLVIDAESDGSLLTTDKAIQWLSQGQYVCRFTLTWNDGTVDKSNSAKITVQPLAT